MKVFGGRAGRWRIEGSGILTAELRRRALDGKIDCWQQKDVWLPIRSGPKAGELVTQKLWLITGVFADLEEAKAHVGSS